MFAWMGRVFGRHDQPAPVATPEPGAPGPQQLLAEGNRLLEAGRLAEAAQHYERALALDGSSVAAAVNLGFVRLEQGRATEAVAPLEMATRCDPDNVDARFLLGRIALQAGRSEQAIEQFEHALRVQPAFRPAKAALVRALAAAERLDEARALASTAVQADPSDAEMQLLNGNLLRIAGDPSGAIDSLRRAVELESRLGEAWLAMAQCHAALGQLDDARGALQRVLAARPDTASLATQVGDEFQRLGDTDAAVAAYRIGLQIDPRHAAACQNMGIALQSVGRYEESLSALESARDLDPASPQAWCNLGIAQLKLRRGDEAEQSFARAQSLLADDASPDSAHAPEYARVQAILAVQALERGATTDALACFERAIALDPSALQPRSHQLFALTYVDDPQRSLVAAREYGRRAAAAAVPYRDWLTSASRTTADRLRVGLVSGDLYAHPVGYFTDSVLPHLRRQGIDLIAFPTSHHKDEVTTRLQSSMAGWLPLGGASDPVAAQRIREAGIDVLLDLGGHTAHNRLPVFCYRPAPVQASWLGYWATTGVDAIDWVLADPLCVGAAEEAQFTEKVWRLPRTRLCFTPPGAQEDFPVSRLPALEGTVTFGTMQNLAKAGDSVLDAWRRVLEGVPGSRLRIQNKQTTAGMESRLRDRLGRAGIAPDRVVLAPPAARATYLAGYSKIDMLLDTFPFPGGTTTCEALWMGVPTVSLAGRSMVGNQGKAMLTCAGLGDWVASDIDDYVQRAIAFASDTGALARLRSRLRAQVLDSPLFDAPAFAADLAAALRGMHESA